MSLKTPQLHLSLLRRFARINHPQGMGIKSGKKPNPNPNLSVRVASRNSQWEDALIINHKQQWSKRGAAQNTHSKPIMNNSGLSAWSIDQFNQNEGIEQKYPARKEESQVLTPVELKSKRSYSLQASTFVQSQPIDSSTPKRKHLKTIGSKINKGSTTRRRYSEVRPVELHYEPITSMSDVKTEQPLRTQQKLNSYQAFVAEMKKNTKKRSKY